MSIFHIFAFLHCHQNFIVALCCLHMSFQHFSALCVSVCVCVCVCVFVCVCGVANTLSKCYLHQVELLGVVRQFSNIANGAKRSPVGLLLFLILCSFFWFAGAESIPRCGMKANIVFCFSFCNFLRLCFLFVTARTCKCSMKANTVFTAQGLLELCATKCTACQDKMPNTFVQ